jgi:hypothetical protein
MQEHDIVCRTALNMKLLEAPEYRLMFNQEEVACYEI